MPRRGFFVAGGSEKWCFQARPHVRVPPFPIHSLSPILPAAVKPTPEDLQQALPPILSLIHKSEKALQKLAAETWQAAMLRENLDALRLARALMGGEAPDSTHESSQNALRPLASMIERTRTVQPKFPPGTSQHTLLQHRLQALLIAEELIRSMPKVGALPPGSQDSGP